MNRRGFLGMLIGGVAAAAAEQMIPLGRVWSFPSKIVIPEMPVVELAQYSDYISLSSLPTLSYDRRALEVLKRNLVFRTYKNVAPVDEDFEFG